MKSLNRKQIEDAMDALKETILHTYDEGFTSVEMSMQRALIDATDWADTVRRYDPGSLRVHIECRNPHQTKPEEWDAEWAKIKRTK